MVMVQQETVKAAPPPMMKSSQKQSERPYIDQISVTVGGTKIVKGREMVADKKKTVLKTTLKLQGGQQQIQQEAETDRPTNRQKQFQQSSAPIRSSRVQSRAASATKNFNVRNEVVSAPKDTIDSVYHNKDPIKISIA